MDKYEMDEMEAMEDEISALEDRLKRYKEALEVIRDNPRFNNGVTACDIAREALSDA